jgi:hypothetical protein
MDVASRRVMESVEESKEGWWERKYAVLEPIMPPPEVCKHDLMCFVEPI